MVKVHLHSANVASLLHPSARAALGTPRLAALLNAQIRPGNLAFRALRSGRVVRHSPSRYDDGLAPRATKAGRLDPWTSAKAGWQAMCCGSRHGELFDVVVGILANGRRHMLIEHYRWLSSRGVDGGAAFAGPSAVQKFYRGLSDRMPMAPESSPAVAGRVRLIVRPPMHFDMKPGRRAECRFRSVESRASGISPVGPVALSPCTGADVLKRQRASSLHERDGKSNG